MKNKSSLAVAKKLQEERGNDEAIYFLEQRLRKLGVYVKGKKIDISRVWKPLGNKAWGMIGFLQAVGQYYTTDFAQYQKNVFGEDGYNFYSWKRIK